jgi:hypothetical protein
MLDIGKFTGTGMNDKRVLTQQETAQQHTKTNGFSFNNYVSDFSLHYLCPNPLFNNI